MSSTHLRLEGPDLPSLLEQVRAEYGPGARIVHAERIRRGGVGGFFARERYHVEVEVSEGSEVRAPSAGPVGGQPAGPVGRGASSARSVLDLVDRLNQEEDAAHRRYGAPYAPAPGPAAPGGPAQGAAVTAPPWAAAWPAPSLVPAYAAAGPAGAPALSTQSASFADVLSRLQHSVSDVAEAPMPMAVPTSPATGSAARVADPTEPVDPAARRAPAGPRRWRPSSPWAQRRAPLRPRPLRSRSG